MTDDLTAASIGNNTESIDDELLRILVCPIDHAPLRRDAASLVCTRCDRRYPVEDGIPNMLVDLP